MNRVNNSCPLCTRPLDDVLPSEYVTWPIPGIGVELTFCSKPCHDDYLTAAGRADEVQ